MTARTPYTLKTVRVRDAAERAKYLGKVSIRYRGRQSSRNQESFGHTRHQSYKVNPNPNPNPMSKLNFWPRQCCKIGK